MLTKSLCQQVAQLAHSLHNFRVPRIAAANELVPMVERVCNDVLEQKHLEPQNVSLVARLIVGKTVCPKPAVFIMTVQHRY